MWELVVSVTDDSPAFTCLTWYRTSLLFINRSFKKYASISSVLPPSIWICKYFWMRSCTFSDLQFPSLCMQQVYEHNDFLPAFMQLSFDCNFIHRLHIPSPVISTHISTHWPCSHSMCDFLVQEEVVCAVLHSVAMILSEQLFLWTLSDELKRFWHSERPRCRQYIQCNWFEYVRILPV